MNWKSFKTYLNEKKYPVRNGMKEWALMIDGKLPLKGTLYDELMFIPKAFRVTSNLHYLVKDEGKKRQTPAFLRGSQGIKTGAASGNAYLIELEGYTSVHLPYDAATGLSRSGYRWLLRDNQIAPFQKVMLPKVKEWLIQKY